MNSTKTKIYFKPYIFNRTTQLNKVTQDLNLICICKQKTLSPFLSINSCQKDQALPVKTSNSNFVTFWSCISETACLISCEISLFVYGSKPGRHFARNLREFGVARSEVLEVNQWIVQDIHWLNSQSERVKNTMHCFSIY